MTVSSTHPTARKPSIEQAALIRVELAAILASDSFSSSKRCQDFLEFVVEHALRRDYESLSERSLGVELFGRAIDYETATDSIVRVRANDVRRRLAQFYSRRRPEAPARIDLIAGGYIPEFHWRSESEDQPSQAPELPAVAAGPPSPDPSAGQLSTLDAERRSASDPRVRRLSPLWRWSGAAMAAVAAILLALALQPSRTNFDRFWRPVLDAPAAPVLSLPTSDTFQLELSSTQTSDRLQSSNPIKPDPAHLLALHDWHVSLPVLQATLSVALALNRKGKAPLVRVGTDLRRDELRGHPTVAIGSFSNPWTAQNVAGLRFTFDRGVSDREPPRIRDSSDPRRSWSLPHVFPEPQAKDYAIVTRTFDPATREPFVSLAGLHSFGNQIAGEFVSQESSWDEVARRAPSGWDKMNLQVVLETNIVGTTPSSPKIVAVYFWK